MRRIRLGAALRVERVEGAQTQAQMWLRLERADGSTIFLDNGGELGKRVTSPNWTMRRIEADVPQDAAKIALGFLLSGPGRAWVDDTALTITAVINDEKAEPPSPMTARSLRNLTAFAKLYGYVRYFHPSDQASATMWESFVMEGVRESEPAESDEALVARLNSLFSPIAPRVPIYLGTQTPPAIISEPGPEAVQYKYQMFDHYFSNGVKMRSAAAKELPVFQAELVPGIVARVPLAVYADAGGTLPHAAIPVPRYYSLTVRNRAVRLTDVIIAWNVLQHFYPYFGVLTGDWPKALSTALESAATDKDGLAFLSTLRHMVATLRDGHGRVIWGATPLLQSPVGWDWVEDRLVITDVPNPQGPAIEPGDIVVAINGKPVSAVFREAAAGISSPTSQLTLARVLGTGLHYGTMTLGAIGEGLASEPLVLELQPFKHPGPRHTVTLDRQVSRQPLREKRPAPISELTTGIIYVDLTRISTQEWQAALPKLDKASGLIFDMRGYPNISTEFLGNLSRTPMTSPQWHAPQVVLPDHLDMKFEKSDWMISPREPYLKAKRAFLTDGRAISYAETIMGFVEHYRLGPIVGGPTAGTNGDSRSFDVPGGYNIRFTAIKTLKQDGSQHHGVGILPTVPMKRTVAGVVAGKDEVLKRGLELLR